MKTMNLGTGIFVHKIIIITAVMRVEFLSDRMQCIMLRVCWCHIVLNIHAPTEDEIDYVKNSFYEEM
jgi:hypothetical protein